MLRLPASRLDIGVLMAEVEAAPPVAAADVLGSHLARTMGAVEVSFLIADFSGEALIRLSHAAAAGATRTHGQESAHQVELEGTPQGRALADQAVQVVAGAGGAWVYAPVTSRGEAVGVLELLLSDVPDEQTLADIALAAHALAYMVIAGRRYTDLFVWGQRSLPLSLAGEIQHRLLPASFTCEAGQFTVAGWLEPAGDVGGDTFDFALERDTLHLSITDAMGHTVEAALLASLVVGALRNARRRGVDLAEQTRWADHEFSKACRGGQFATGQVARVDLAAGSATLVNAGHPAPFRLRAGIAEQLTLEIDPPFGLDHGAFRVQSLPLEAGDRLMFVTDGILERNGRLDITTALTAGARLHPREAVQRLTQAVLRASKGKLQDDATIMCLDWHGGPPRQREASSGADQPV